MLRLKAPFVIFPYEPKWYNPRTWLYYYMPDCEITVESDGSWIVKPTAKLVKKYSLFGRRVTPHLICYTAAHNTKQSNNDHET